MVREPDATMQPASQDNQLMSKHGVLSFKPQLRLEWRGQNGQNETEHPDHYVSLGNYITSSTRIELSVHTGHPDGRIATGAQQLSPIRRPDALDRVRNAGQRGMPKTGRTF